MEKQEIVKLFLSHGFQLSESALSLVEENPEKTLSFIQKINPRPFIITKDHLKDVYEEKEEKQTKVKLVKKFIFQKKDIRVEDYSRYFRNIYDKVKEFLLKNPKLTGLISINKITSNTKDFSLIVLVCDKGQRNLLVEDLTGETHVFFNEKNEKIFDEIDADDILGLVCTKEGENIYAKDLLYPDISITREVNKTKKEIRIFYIYKPSLLCEADFNKLSGILKQTKKTDPIFVFGEWEDGEVMKEFNNLFLVGENTSHSLFQIENISILTLPKTNSMENILKKRLVKTGELLKTFALEETPDIVLSSEKETYFKNYKGTTIVSNNDQHKYFVLDLKTRDCEEKKI